MSSRDRKERCEGMCVDVFKHDCLHVVRMERISRRLQVEEESKWRTAEVAEDNCHALIGR